MCARAHVCACVHHIHSLAHSVTFVFVCAFHCSDLDDSLYSGVEVTESSTNKQHTLSSLSKVVQVCCVHLAVLGTVGGGLASSAHEWLLQRLAAVIAQRGIAVALATRVLRPCASGHPSQESTGDDDLFQPFLRNIILV